MSLPLAKIEPTAADLRAETRTHLFVLAKLSAGPIATTVHIRNLSENGALVEAHNLPDIGEVVNIRRGSLSVDGVLAWKAKGHAGIAFKSSIVVAAWLPTKSRSQQCAVDQIVFESRGTKAVTNIVSRHEVPADPNWAAAELNSLRSELVQLGDALIQDIILVATHPEVQILDSAIQRIDRILRRGVIVEATRK